MKFIEFDKTKCDNCFKCLRICPTKAISFNKDERNIIDHLCIKCGLCQKQCPQEALKIKNAITDIKKILKSNRKTAVSIAPSFIGAFDMHEPEQMVTVLKKLGFEIIEETAVGAEIITINYEKNIAVNKQKNIITSCCPSANYLIEHHYPEMIEYMLPIVSPMVAHGKYIKKRYGDDCYVVFIGPCLAKMAEAEEMNGTIDAVITFAELSKWMDSENISLMDQEGTDFNIRSTTRGKAFPMGAKLDHVGDGEQSHYRFSRISGMSQCDSLLKELKTGNIEGYCFEMNICDGSCNNGPDIPGHISQRFEREKRMLDYVEKSQKRKQPTSSITGKEVSVTRTFKSQKVAKAITNPTLIKEILRQMGKYTLQDELNCGACGYNSCQDKAQAVYDGHSDVHNCLAYLRGKAENMHSILIENSPNAVCTVDDTLTIIENNPMFDTIFNQTSIKIEGVPIYTFVDEHLFIKALKEKKNVIGEKIYVEDVDKYFIVNIIHHEKEDLLLSFFTDITPIEKKKKTLEKVKKETLLKTQEVIDKQMRVAQEIASLLGETTAETKLSLNSLKELVLE